MSEPSANAGRLAARWAGFGTSIFTEMTDLARARGAVNLAQGFPDFLGPDELLRAIASHVETSHHQYAPGNGEERLRRAVSRFVASTTGIERAWASEVTITTGATEAIYSTVNAVVNPGDRVVVFEPLYDSYAQAVAQAGGVVVPIRLHPPDAATADWRVDWDELDRATAAGFRMLILNSPHNPTGKVFDEGELARIARALRAADAVALCDEVYEQMTYDGARHVSLSTLPEVRDQVVRISSAAKSFGFTGLKVGWATASRELSSAVRLVHQATVFSTNPFLQTAIAQVLEDDAWMERYLAELRTTYQAKRDLLIAALTAAGFDVPAVRGTYFVMASFARLAPELTDLEMTRRLVEEKGVAAIPPSVFYARPPGPLPWLRFAFCKKDETLALAAQRLVGAQARP
jgi:aspartate/methionine/tyrosine aminotransferase